MPPAAVGSPARTTTSPTAEWQRVDVTTDGSNCELLQQVGRKVLPLFRARNAHFSSSCPALAATAAAPSQQLTAEAGTPIAKIPALAHLVGRGALQGAGTASISFGIRFRPHALGGQRSVVEHVRLIGV